MNCPLKLCLITSPDYLSFNNYFEFLSQAIQGGITSVQLRDKKSTLASLRKTAFNLNQFLKPLNIPLIINDHIDVALEVDAAGVHIGQEDCMPEKARQLLGPHKLIGLSVETLQDLEFANQLTCIDYIAASAVFQSQTKLDCKTQWGLAGLSQVVRQSKHPVMAIGGINTSNIPGVMACGVIGVAVISAIHQARSPQIVTVDLINQINQGSYYERTN